MFCSNRLLLSVMTVFLLCGSALSSSPSLDDFIYPDNEITESILQIDDEHLDAALYAAFERLTEMGGDSILVCRFQRIEAPLGGYLVDGLCHLNIDGNNYSTFRIGIEDGVEDKHFIFIAMGTDENDAIIWYPEPGPDYIPNSNQIIPESFLTYEFLMNRNEFENLENEFPRPDADNSGE